MLATLKNTETKVDHAALPCVLDVQPQASSTLGKHSINELDLEGAERHVPRWSQT